MAPVAFSTKLGSGVRYYGYGFLPVFPYEAEGGTILVIRGDYPTIEERIEDDEKYKARMKGKTPEMLKAEKKQAIIDAEIKRLEKIENDKKLAAQEFKLKCNPLSDPGYSIRQSDAVQSLVEALQRYIGCWSLYDKMPPKVCGEVVFGYLQALMTEDLMSQIHIDCRRYVDELMRQEYKLLMQAHKDLYKSIGMRFPKMRPRKRPPVIKQPAIPLEVDDTLLQGFEYLFDLGIITKPTNKIDDIIGDSNYSAYERNIADPNSSFPMPGYGDVRNRLMLSCVFGSGIEPNATRNNAVLLIGAPRNGKSFLVDCVAGEMNAVKIDVSPEVFSSKLKKPGKAMTDVFKAARVFQPCVVFMKNVERVFWKKTPRDMRYLKATKVKPQLIKCVKNIVPEENIIFIASCSLPTGIRVRPMVSIFSEMILIPRVDYGSLQLFFYNSLQRIRSMERDYCVQAMAQSFQGYGFGVIFEAFNRVLDAERIMRLNVTPLSPVEFSDYLEKYEQLSLQDYQLYENFVIKHSRLRRARDEIQIINKRRAEVYQTLEEAKAKREAKREAIKENEDE